MPSESPAHSVVTLIRGRLRESKISQETVAARLDLSQQAISRRLSGEVEFSLTELTVVAELLDTPLAELVASPAERAA